MSITVDVSGGVCEVRLDHPPVNALDSKGWAKLAETLQSIGRDPASKVVLLTGAGRGFCAGVDIKELAAHPERIVEVNRGCAASFEAVYECPVPVVAAVHNFVLGGGIGLAGAADLVVAASDASFGLPEIDRGALGAATHAMRLFGQQAARRMLFTGEPVGAEEAYRLGGVAELVEGSGDEARAAGRELAEKIAGKSPRAMRLAKESLNGIELLDVVRSYRYEQGFTLELYTDPDSGEARDAFVEKREAKFKETP